MMMWQWMTWQMRLIYRSLLKVEVERQEEDGRTKIFEFEFFVFSIFGFGPSNFGTQHLERHISVACHVTRCHVILCLSHTRFCNK